jgi:hypothetical protein
MECNSTYNQIANKSVNYFDLYGRIIPSETVSDLISAYDCCWSVETKKFADLPFNQVKLEEKLLRHNQQFQPIHNIKDDYGYIGKKDLWEKTQIFVRADLHGDLKSVLENIKTAQKEGLLDENYKCLPNVQLVFLGDYMDRGEHGMEILNLLISLRMENPDQVTLIRGNHESLNVNLVYGETDRHLQEFLKSSASILDDLYNTLPLTMYMSQRNPEGKRAYVHFTHGMFELNTDVSGMLDSDVSRAAMIIPKKDPAKLSERMLQLVNGDTHKEYMQKIENANAEERKALKVKCAAAFIHQLLNPPGFFSSPYNKMGLDIELTAYNWGDMCKKLVSLRSLGARQWKISPMVVKNYFLVSTSKHKVKLLMRGHEHQKQHHEYEGKIIVSTMPVGMDSMYGNRYIGQQDTAYILQTDVNFKNLTKKAYERSPGTSEVTISNPVHLRDGSI